MKAWREAQWLSEETVSQCTKPNPETQCQTTPVLTEGTARKTRSLAVGWHGTREHWFGQRAHPLTEDSGHKPQGELGGEHGEKPGRGVEAGADLVLLQVVVEVPVVVVEEPRELVHLDLQGHRVSVTVRCACAVTAPLTGQRRLPRT